MPEINTYSLTEVMGASALAIIAAFIGAQKLLKDWKSTNAETSVITLMHEELERMASQNSKLSVELNKLQLEVVKLNQELRCLIEENQRLHIEVVALTTEVSRLQSTMTQGANK